MSIFIRNLSRLFKNEPFFVNNYKITAFYLSFLLKNCVSITLVVLLIR
ncbi:hypothetical protein T190130A13A_50293 [Tenacibaculum sp. 190130A14a]|uniref:Uncharacterized protein n=1 Tax=Tenacibaculum polynesiense TaxID=3137857 RepID=A0ABM9PDS6_9FLAO